MKLFKGVYPISGEDLSAVPVKVIGPAVAFYQSVLGFTVVAAAALAVESLVFIGVHAKYREITPIILSAVLGLLMAFIAYGRLVLYPIF